MSLRLGPLNRRIQLWRDYPLIGASGAVTPRLRHVCYMPATLGEVGAKDDVVAMKDANMQSGMFTTRYKALDYTATYYVDFEGRRFRLARWKEVGRREGLVLFTEQVV